LALVPLGPAGKHPPSERVVDSMTGEVRPLSNDRWGFESSCFVCEPRNAAGLRIPFAHAVGEQRVFATFTLDERFSGAPAYVHGGVLLAILDEAMAWATIAIAEKFAVTRETTSRFERPVKLHREHRVEGWIEQLEAASITTGGRITRTDGTVCVEAQATFAVLGIEQAENAAGAAIGDDLQGFTT
jgi:acyl-coenzyme A thioesterase PaaI-like protein